MTPEQEKLILRLAVMPGRPHSPPSREELLAAFDAYDGRALCHELLHRAIEAHLPILRTLAREPWHTRHRDITWDLEELAGPDAVEDLDFLA